MGDINFDLLQKEISEAENYLRGSSENPRISSKVRSSQNNSQNANQLNFLFETENNDSSSIIDSSANKNKYFDPIERQKLIEKVIVQHNVPAIKYFDDVVFGEDTSETIFFASDVTTQNSSWYENKANAHNNIHDDDIYSGNQRYFDEFTQNNVLSSTTTNDQSVDDGMYDTRYLYEPVENETLKPFERNDQDILGKVIGESSTESVVPVVSPHISPQVLEKDSAAGFRHLKSKEDLLVEAEIEFNKKCSFQPKMGYEKDSQLYQSAKSVRGSLFRPTSSSRGREVVKAAHVDDSLQASVRPRVTEFKTSQRVDELHAADQARKSELANLRRDQMALELSVCTFQPQLSKGTHAIIAKSKELHSLINEQSRGEQMNFSDPSCSPLDVSHRLYEEAKSRATQQQWLEKQIQDARVAQYSFQPSINPLAVSVIDHQPLFERIAQVQREKKQHLMDLRDAVEEEQKVHLTFVPKIDERSRRLVQRRESSASTGLLSSPGLTQAKHILGFHRDPGSRLMEEGRAAIRRKQQLLQDREASLAVSMEPSQISSGTKRIAQKSKLVG
jgi:hypothetical protein